MDENKEFNRAIGGAIIGGIVMCTCWILFGLWYSLGVWLGMMFVIAFVGLILWDTTDPPEIIWHIITGIGCSPFYALPTMLLGIGILGLIYEIRGLPFPDPPFGLLFGGKL